MSDEAVDTRELFEQAYSLALEDVDPVVRRRAAQRIGRAQGVGPNVLAGLARTMAYDADQSVRAAALAALDELDAEVTLPPRLLKEWAEDPPRAYRYLDDVFVRLTNKEENATAAVSWRVR